MSPLSLLAAAEPAATQPSIGTPTLWAITIGAIVVLLVVDFLITRRPHDVSMKEAVGWSAFYVAIPVGFGVWIWQQYGQSGRSHGTSRSCLIRRATSGN